LVALQTFVDRQIMFLMPLQTFAIRGLRR
jgi:hypothetical protein